MARQEIIALAGTVLAAAIIDELEALSPGARARIKERTLAGAEMHDDALNKELAEFIRAMP